MSTATTLIVEMHATQRPYLYTHILFFSPTYYYTGALKFRF